MMNATLRAQLLLRVLCTLFLVGIAFSSLYADDSESTPAAASDIAKAQVSADYTVSPDDVLDIYIIDVPEMSRQYRVSPAGTITLPLLQKPVSAVGLSLDQLSASVTEALKTSGLVSNAQVTISVRESRVHSVAIAGAVKKPQIYPVLAPTTLLDVLSQAEGLAEDASNSAIIYRGEVARAALGVNSHTVADTEAAMTRVDVKQLLESGDPNLNVIVYPGDRITVPRAGLIYVVGAVNQPGGYAMKGSRQGTTILQAIALAKDLKSTAQRSKSIIIRTDANSGERTQIPVDLAKILSGKAADPALQQEDILFIPDSSSKRVLRRGLEAIVQTATGVAIYGR